MKNYKVLGIGEVVLDKTYVLTNFPKEDAKVRPIKVEYSVGGPATAALMVLARFGVDCTLFASVGGDREGQIIVNRLAQEGIRLVGPKKGRTKVNNYLVNSKNGSRTGIKSEVVYSALKRVPLDLLCDIDVIIADRHELSALSHAIENKHRKTKVIIDPSTEISRNTMNMIRNADYPILPISALKNMPKKSRRENLFLLYNLVKRPIIVTAGKYGSLIYDGTKIDLVPALKVKAVDSLGAGDVYRGAFAWGVMNKWSLARCARYANSVGALQCTKLGNGTAIPTKDEITSIQREAQYKNITLEKIGI